MLLLCKSLISLIHEISLPAIGRLPASNNSQHNQQSPDMQARRRLTVHVKDAYERPSSLLLRTEFQSICHPLTLQIQNIPWKFLTFHLALAFQDDHGVDDLVSNTSDRNIHLYRLISVIQASLHQSMKMNPLHLP